MVYQYVSTFTGVKRRVYPENVFIHRNSSLNSSASNEKAEALEGGAGMEFQ